MLPWTFYPAFAGTLISVVAWTYFARKEHVAHAPRTLSELAAEKPETLRYYRTVLWTCGPLFAITTLLFITPRITHSLIVGLTCALTVITELIIGFFPAKKGIVTSHDIIAAVMGSAMIATAYLFAWNLASWYAFAELVFALCMSVLGIFCVIDRSRYLFYELPLIYLAHFSVLVAALALR